MTTGLYKKGMVLGIICLFIGASIVPSISGNIREENDKIPVALDLDDDVPIWNVGDKWIYRVEDINIDSEEEGISLHINLDIGDLTLLVMDVSQDSYKVEFNAEINGDFTVNLDDFSFEVTGRFAKLPATKLEGDIVYRKSDLGIMNVNTDLSGTLKVKIKENPFIPIPLPTIRVPFDITLDINFDNPYPILDFPLHTYKVWGLPSTNVSVDGKISSVWLRLINFINNVLRIFGIDLIPPEYTKFLPVIDIGDVLEEFHGGSVFELSALYPVFACFNTEDVMVEAGIFNAYNITIGEGNGNFYYAPEAGNIIKMSVDGNVIADFIANYLGFPVVASDINMSLIEIPNS